MLVFGSIHVVPKCVRCPPELSLKAQRLDPRNSWPSDFQPCCYVVATEDWPTRWLRDRVREVWIAISPIANHCPSNSRQTGNIGQAQKVGVSRHPSIVDIDHKAVKNAALSV